MSRKLQTEPRPRDKRIIELAQDSLKVKNFNLKEIGLQVAKEFNQPPVSRQRILQVLQRWQGYNGFQWYISERVSRAVAAKCKEYAKPNGINLLSGREYSALTKLGIPKRGQGRRK